jgi:hypothetical protein
MVPCHMDAINLLRRCTCEMIAAALHRTAPAAVAAAPYGSTSSLASRAVAHEEDEVFGGEKEKKESAANSQPTEHKWRGVTARPTAR